MVDQVTFPPSIGGSGKTYTNDSNPQTGMFNGGHRINFFPVMSDMVAAAGYVSRYAQAIDGAKANADKAENARAYVEAYAGALKNNIETYYDKLATLKLDFGRGKYFVDDGDLLTETTNPLDLLTVTRATTKLVVGPNGKLREVPIDTVARQWRNGVPRGILIDGSRTNLALWSEDFTNSAWSKTAISIASSEPFEGLSDTLLAHILVENNSIGEHRIQQTIQALAGEVYTMSAYVDVNKCDKGPYLRFAGAAAGSVILDITTLTPVLGVGEIEHIHGSIYRLSATATADSNGTLFARWGIYDGSYSYQGDGQSTIYLGIPQLEEGSGSSSYIPTTDAPVTRAADNVSRALGEEFNPREGTLYAEFYPGLDNTDSQVIFGVSDGTSSNRTLMRHTYANNKRILFLSVRGGVVSFRQEANVLVEGLNKVALSYNQSGWTLAANGYTHTLSDVTGDVVATTAHLSNAPGSNQDNSAKGTVRYIPRALSESELIELTS